GRDPRGDLRADAAAAVAAAAERRPAEEVVDLARSDVLLELREARRRVAAIEAADRHDRKAGRELVAGGVVRPDGRGDPGVPGAARPQTGDQLGAGPGGVEQPAHATGTSATREAAARERATGRERAALECAALECAAAREAGAPAAEAATGAGHRGA